MYPLYPVTTANFTSQFSVFPLKFHRVVCAHFKIYSLFMHVYIHFYLYIYVCVSQNKMKNFLKTFTF